MKGAQQGAKEVPKKVKRCCGYGYEAVAEDEAVFCRRAPCNGRALHVNCVDPHLRDVHGVSENLGNKGTVTRRCPCGCTYTTPAAPEFR